MKPDRVKKAWEVFRQACLREPSERAAFLDEACGDDPEVRARVEALLAADETQADFIDEPGLGEGVARRAAEVLAGETTGPPKTIGHYAIKDYIGSGGMADVYLAVQEHPRRKVALKLMKRGITSRSALRRFEFESQILARLRHPNIAQVYDAGTHDDGSGGVPYFAMEYVPGHKPITEYAKHEKLTTKERLKLFAKVCDAVHHGHQKGIIHRDLKPGNILVDSSGEPKVIDFGVARCTDSDMAVTTLQTDIGQLIGTLQYMSPEQCQADPDDLDTRSDVYALGVVLYELLREQLPYDVTKATVFEAARVVKEEQPRKPSTINRTLRGDVETIALKALEKERRRRYQSSLELYSDIQRHLRNEPIEAKRDSSWYVLRKIMSRRKWPIVTALGLVLLLMTVYFLWARAERLAAAQQKQHLTQLLESDWDPSDLGSGTTAYAISTLYDDFLARLRKGRTTEKERDLFLSNVIETELLTREICGLDYYWHCAIGLSSKVNL
jgi:serine/threonine protein kinase